MKTLNLKVDPFNIRAAHDDDLHVTVVSDDQSQTDFIVRAVNHHEALVEALRMVAADREFNDIERTTRNAVQDALDALDAAE